MIKKPLPPGFTTTIFGKDDEFITKYMSQTPDYFTTGDHGMVDVNGYLKIFRRSEDFITMKDHNLPSGQVEDMINCHDEVAESTVVQYQSTSKGNVPLAYVILILDNSAEPFHHHDKDGESANDPKCCSYLNDAGKNGLQKMDGEMKLAFEKIANEIK